MTRAALQIGQVLQIADVGEIVEVDDSLKLLG